MALAVPDAEVVQQIERIASWLGWPCPSQEHSKTGVADHVAFWWEAVLSGELRLQINCCPIGQFSVFAGAVYADSYCIRSGFHRMPAVPFETWSVERRSYLQSFLAMQHFASEAGRSRYVRIHPECSGPWDAGDLPHDVV